MNWSKFSSLLKVFRKKQKTEKKDLDKRLFNKFRSKPFPSFRQIKYLRYFLDKKEKTALSVSLFVIVLTSIIWASIAIIRNIETVPTDGGDYTEAVVGQPKYINPLFSSINEVDEDLVSLIYSGLFKYNNKYQLIPELASGYEISEDQKTYTITLRQDVKWNANESFTADDIVFTFQTVQNPDIGSPYYTSFQGVEIIKIDDYTVKFILNEPFAPFLSTLTIGILPEYIWSSLTGLNMKLAKQNIQPVGTGAWKFSKMVKDDKGNIQSYTLEKNELYYDKVPYIDTLVFKFYTDYDQALDALRNGQVHAISFVPKRIKDKIPGKSFTFHKIQLPQYTALFFNSSQQSILENDNVRLALAKAIDKEKILQETLGQEGVIVNSPIPEGSPGYYPDIEKIEYNLDEANTLLDKNWPKIEPEEYFELRKEQKLEEDEYKNRIEEIENNASSTPEMVSSTLEAINIEIEDSVREEMNNEQLFYRKNKDDEILKLTITTADTAEYTQAGEAIASMWQSVGVKTEISTVTGKEIVNQVLKPRVYDILLYGEILGGDPDLYPFWHSSQSDYPGLNLSMFSDRNADKLLEDARVSTDKEERSELYKKFQDILIEELPAIFLYSPSYIFVADNDIKGVELGSISEPHDRYNNIENWYIKTKKSW